MGKLSALVMSCKSVALVFGGSTTKGVRSIRIRSRYFTSAFFPALLAQSFICAIPVGVRIVSVILEVAYYIACNVVTELVAVADCRCLSF